MKLNKNISVLLIIFMLGAIHNVFSAPNQVSLSLGLRLLEQNNLGFSTLKKTGEENLNFINSLQYVHFIRSHFGLGLEVSFAGLNSENIFEEGTSTVPGIISANYYPLSGKLRPFISVGAGPVLGFNAVTEESKSTDSEHLEKNKNEKASEKNTKKLGATACTFLGVDLAVFKGFGIHSEAGYVFEYIKGTTYNKSMYSTTSLLARIGILFQF